MNSDEDFSMEQSEELIANLKSAKPSEFQQLQSALNLLGHVTELPATSMPPILPSGISQPVPLLPVKSAKPRRTIVTSVIVTGILASASLAAAAVTGIGPAPIVNMGHQTAKFVRGVAGAVSKVVTGGNAVTTEVFSPHPQIPGLTPAPTGGDEGSSNTGGGDQSQPSEDLIPGLLSPLSLQIKKSEDGKSSESEKSKISHENQSPQSEDSQTRLASANPIPTSSPSRTKAHTESETHKTAEPTKTTEFPTAIPSPTDTSSDND
jgi:hypothetical protein